MAYERQYYTNGDVLNAEQLNHMEAGIKENSDSVSKLSEEKANRIVETASGETIVVTDSAEEKPLGLAIDGKSEQNQYSGNQMYDSSYRNSANGIVCINGNATESKGIFTVSVTKADTRVWEIVNKGNVYDGFSNGPLVEKPEGATQINVVLSNEAFYQNFITFYDENKVSLGFATYTGNNFVIKGDLLNSSKYLSLRFGLGTAVSSGTYETTVMMNVGETALPWEPFVGGKPSPSTEYEQEIRNIGVYDEASGKYAVEVKCTGKNLINQLCVPGGYTSKHWLKTGVYTVSRDLSETATENTWYLRATDEKNNVITTQAFILSGYNPTAYDLSDSGEWYYGGKGRVSCTFELIEDCYVSLGSLNGSGNTYLQLEYGTVATDYEPYKETTATVYLDEPLRKGDKAYWNGSKVRGDRYRAVEVFDGSEDEGWVAQSTKTSGNFRWTVVANSKYKPITATNVVASVLCDQFIPKSFNNVYDENQGISVDSSGNFSIYDESCKNMTIAEWKAHLAENPITVEYELAEPITEEIDIDLGEFSMFYPTTILSNDCNANMEVEYIADTKAYVDKKITEVITAML